ncbi:MAG: hypothetical protein PF961_06670 [Planctomycetota bacterium]|jgi:hypothetical protein|nr:hypothetical protein [Planctomycetota bacterium]
MPIERGALLGPPHTYLVQGSCACDRPALADRVDRNAFLALLAQLQLVFDYRLYAYAIHASSYRLVLRHRSDSPESEARLAGRWGLLGARSSVPPERLRARLTSLSGLMQTLAQRYSRDYHRRHGGRGTLWAGRYRACLLADDAAVLAAVVWLEHEASALAPAASSRHRQRLGQPRLAPLPLRALPDGSMMPADEAPLDMPPPSPTEADRLLGELVDELSDATLATYGAALSRGWCLGRPESLAEPLSRLGRTAGRGRSRQLRELDDELGLCGVWG